MAKDGWASVKAYPSSHVAGIIRHALGWATHMPHRSGRGPTKEDYRQFSPAPVSTLMMKKSQNPRVRMQKVNSRRDILMSAEMGNA